MVVKRCLSVLFVCLSLTSLAEAYSSANRFHPTWPSQRTLEELRQSVVRDREYDIRMALSVVAVAEESESFGLEQESFIREWFSSQRSSRTPRPDNGASSSLERDGILPEELRQRFQPLPYDLERQLPTLARHLRRGIVLGDVVLLDEDTSRIVDLIHGVVQAK